MICESCAKRTKGIMVRWLDKPGDPGTIHYLCRPCAIQMGLCLNCGAAKGDVSGLKWDRFCADCQECSWVTQNVSERPRMPDKGHKDKDDPAKILPPRMPARRAWDPPIKVPEPKNGSGQ